MRKYTSKESSKQQKQANRQTNGHAINKLGNNMADKQKSITIQQTHLNSTDKH